VVACCNYNLGHLHYTIGEYTRALDILTETRPLTADPWYRALCDLTQSEIYLEMNMYREALEFASSAHAGFEAIQKPFDLARTIGVMAIARSQLREFHEAQRLFEQAKAMFGSQGKVAHAAGMDLHQSVMWLHVGKYAEARAAAGKAHDAFIEEDAKSSSLVKLIIQPATGYNAFIKEGNKSKAAFARIICARASIHLREWDRAANDAAIAATLHEQAPLPVVGYQLHALFGTLHAGRNNAEAARHEFRLAIEDFEAVRANIATDELRLNYLKDKVPVYEMLLTADLGIWEETRQEQMVHEAFETAERAKSRTLVDLLAGSVAALQRVNSSSVDDVRRFLPADSALVEYVVSDGAVIAFCVTPSRFTVFRHLCSTEELETRFNFLQFQLSRLASDPRMARARPSIALANIQDHLEKLYDMLVGPLEHFLGETKSVVFVPSGVLHYLPFHALFDGSGYLVDRFDISYAPSATIYELFMARPRSAHRDALLIGAPDEHAPLIREEIESICSVLNSERTFVGRAATRDCLEREMKSAGLIHIASHATFRPDNPMFSSFQLDDGPINLFDIFKLRTEASLITLSGCGTGLSHVVAGDELLGLVRGFLYAGAASVVLSLWDVNDRTTADLMKHFYSSLMKGQNTAQSLRSAMLHVRLQHPHPFYWAPFLLIGNPARFF
jgi:hypothetical protein